MGIVILTVMLTLAVEAVIAVAGYVIFRVKSPVTYAKRNRATFTSGDVPPPVEYNAKYDGSAEVFHDISYGSKYENGLCDVHLPAKRKHGETFPVIVWIHGGAWFAGDKTGAEEIFKAFCARGYVGVTINYALAPESRFPTQLRQIGEFVTFLPELKKQFPALDLSRLFMGGDSAGGNLLAQYLAAANDKAYAVKLKFNAPLPVNGVRGAVFVSAPFDFGKITPKSNAYYRYIHRVWTDLYFGFALGKREKIKLSAVWDYVNADFPRSFLTDGNDGSYELHNRKMAAELKAKGVKVDELYFDAEKSGKVGHDYLFNLADETARNALETIIDWTDIKLTEGKNGKN